MTKSKPAVDPWIAKMAKVTPVSRHIGGRNNLSAEQVAATRKCFERYVADPSYSMENVAKDLGVGVSGAYSRFKFIRKDLAAVKNGKA